MSKKENIQKMNKNTLYGAPADKSEIIGKEIQFGFGDVSAILQKTEASTGLIAFGFDDTLNSGAVAVGGHLVSSKVLDVSLNKQNSGNETKLQITTLNGSNKETVNINLLDASAINNTYVSEITAVNPITVTQTGNKTYEIDITVDDNVIKIDDDKLTGYYYKIKPATTTEGALKTYQLYKVLGTDTESTEIPVEGSTIDIPKDFVLKEVHLCKATTTEEQGVITYEETAKQGDADFDNADGELYLHFTWTTKADVEGTVESETYLLVTSFAPVYTGDANTGPDSSVNKFVTVSQDHVISIDSSKLLEPVYKTIEDNELVLVKYLEYADTSINKNAQDIATLNASVNAIENRLNWILI